MMAASPAVQSHHPIPQRGTQPPPTRQTKPTRSSTPIQVDDDDRKDEGLTSDDANLDGSGNVSSSSSDSPLAELAARGPTPARTAKASSPHLAASNPPAIASTSSSWLSAFASDPAAWQVYLSHAKALINDTANSSPQHAATGLAALDTFQPAQPPAKIGQAPPAVKLKFVKLLAQAKSDQFFDELAVLEDERERLVDTLVDWLTNALDVVEKAPEGDVKKLGPDDATAYECALPLLKVFKVLPLEWPAIENYAKSKNLLVSIRRGAKVADASVKRLCKELVQRYKTMQSTSAAEEAKPKSGATSKASAKNASAKRKAEPTTTSTEDARKKLKVETKPSVEQPVSNDAADVAPPAPKSAAAVLASKAGASNTSGALPSFKKSAKPAASSSAAASSRAASLTPFQRTLAAARGKNASTPSPTAPTPTQATAPQAKKETPASGSSTSAGKQRAGDKPKKSVKFRDEELCEYRYIERIDRGDTVRDHDALRQMDQQEGVTMEMHIEDDDEEDEPLQAEMEWYTPYAVAVPETEEFNDWRREPNVPREPFTADEVVPMDLETSLPSTPASPPPQSTPSSSAAPKEIPLHKSLSDDPWVMQMISMAQNRFASPTMPASQEQLQALLSQVTAQSLGQPSSTSQGFGDPNAMAYASMPPASMGHYPAVSANPNIASLVSQLDPNAIQHALSGGGAQMHMQQPQQVYPPANNPVLGGAIDPAQLANLARSMGVGAGVPEHWGSGAYSAGSSAGNSPRRDNSSKNFKRTVCKFYNTGRGCDRGQKCKFQHVNSR